MSLKPTFDQNWIFVNSKKPGPEVITDKLAWRPEAAIISSLCSHFFEKELSYVGFNGIERDIKPEYFETGEGRFFWELLLEIKDRNLTFDMLITFDLAREKYVREYHEELPKTAALCIANLFDESFVSFDSVKYHVNKFLQNHFRSELKKNLSKNEPNAFIKGLELRNELDKLLMIDQSQNANLFDTKLLATSLFDELMDREANPEKYKRLSWGYEKHDQKIPISAGNLVIIGGRSGSGKTTYALNLALKMLLRDKKIGFFSLEMTKEELGRIFIGMIARVPSNLFYNISEMSDEQYDKIVQSVGLFSTKQLVTVELPNLSIEDIRRNALQMKTKMDGLDAIFIDHIHIMGAGTHKFQTIREKIIHISAELKNLAKELEIPVFALAQMNRNAEMRQDKTPNVSDLKESGSIEQDADVIVFTFRSTEVDKNEDPYIICRKNRHGSENDFKIFMEVDPQIKIFTEKNI